MSRGVYNTRLERFRRAQGLATSTWARTAGLSRRSFDDVRAGADPYVRTIRAIVRAACLLLSRTVEARELFDIGEDTPEKNIIARKVVAKNHLRSLKRYGTNLDRILRGEQILPGDFARHVGIVRQTLLRLRTGEDEPCLSTLAAMVQTLRGMTGKPYKARHLYDVGEASGAAVENPMKPKP
jgi:predicted transcriptional regulator